MKNKDRLIWIDMDRCIIYYDSISTKNTLDEVTVITLPTVKRFEKILGEIICTMNRETWYSRRSWQVVLLFIQGVFMLRHLQKRKKIRMHVNRRDQKSKKVLTL